MEDCALKKLRRADRLMSGEEELTPEESAAFAQIAEKFKEADRPRSQCTERVDGDGFKYWEIIEWRKIPGLKFS